MFTVVTLTMGIVVAIGIAGFTFNSFLFHCRREQYEADAMAVCLAGEINKDDRVGQLNEFEQCSRELMYVLRQDLKHCSDEDYSFLAPLCRQLLSQARSNHKLLERERQNQICLFSNRMQEDSLRYNSAARQETTFRLPWLQIAKPEVVQIDVGYIDNVESNVKSPEAIEELTDFDRRKGFIDTTTKLYRGNINAFLPDEDNDLSFNISSLPAYVAQTCSPVRNTNPNVFIRTGTIFSNGETMLGSIDHIPTAVQVFYSMNVSLDLQHQYKNAVNLVSTGATNGAVAEFE